MYFPHAMLEKAKRLAQYGMAAVVFDKRGAAQRQFDCDKTTIDSHTDDLLRIIEEVARLAEVDPDRIGLIGGSYGGWVAPRAAARSKHTIAFIISVVGPSTSVKKQQLDNAVYFAKEQFKGNQMIVDQIQSYTLLEYEINNDEETFKKMMELLS